MVSSISYGHNTNSRADVVLFPSCAWGEERMLPRKIGTKWRWEVTEQGQHCHLEEGMVGDCVAPTKAAELEVPSSPYPGQICPSCSAQHTPLSCLRGLLCAASAPQNEACTKWEEWAGAGSAVHSPTPCSTEKMQPFLFTSKTFCLSPA